MLRSLLNLGMHVFDRLWIASDACIIIHERLFNDDSTGPWPVAAINITMLLWCEGNNTQALN
jgi:hypothetical protein